MKYCLPLLAVLLCFGAQAADWHHIHLSAPDTAAAATWYADNFDGTAAKFGPLDVTVVQGTTIGFQKLPEGFPGSVGSSVDHIGFSVEDLEAKIKAFEDGGTKILVPVRSIGTFKLAFIEDPWGTKIEVVQDPDIIGFHHIHLHTPDPDATLAWYADAFGGEVTKFLGFLPAIKYNGIWLIAQKTKAKEPTKGRAIDHLGWSFGDLDKAAEELKAKGVKFTLEPMAFQNLKISFIEGPDGVRIELVQPAPEG